MEEAILSQIRTIVFDMQRGVVSKDEGLNLIRRLLADSNFKESRVRRVLQEAEREFEWIQARTELPYRQMMFQNIVEEAGNQYAKTKRGLTAGVIDIIRRSNGKQTTEELESELQNVVGWNRRYFATIARTAMSAFDSAGKIDSFVVSGFQWFRYVGANAERSFCVEHLGKLYHLTEILGMSNGQGLPVFIYKGGWNCRHQWTPEAESVARSERPEWFRDNAPDGLVTLTAKDIMNARVT